MLVKALDAQYQETINNFLLHDKEYDRLQALDNKESTTQTRLSKAGEYQKAVYQWRKLPLTEKQNIEKQLPQLTDCYPMESFYGGKEF